LFSGNRAILANASSLVATSGVTSALGFAYWWLAARQFQSSAVGVASAAISAMMLLGSVSAFGLGTLLIGELPRRQHQAASLITTALAAAGTIGGVLGILFACIAPRISPDFDPLASSFRHIGLFALGTSVTASTIILDQALIGLLRGGLQLWRNTLFAVAKLGALLLVAVAPAGTSGMSIYGTWAAGNLFSLLWIAILAFRRGGSWHAYRPRLNLLRGVWRTALSHHALNLTLQAPILILPLIVTARLSATANAHFYIAWMLAGFVFIGPSALTTVLYAVGAAEPAVIASKTRLTLGLSLCIGAGACVVLQIGAEQVLHLFGRAYAAEAAMSLRILTFAVFPLIVKNHFVAIRRITGRVAGTARWTAFAGLLELALATTGASVGGLPALCAGWVAALIIEVLLMAATVYKVAFPAVRPTSAPANLPTQTIEPLAGAAIHARAIAVISPLQSVRSAVERHLYTMIAKR
jgi:O-antigen/teichoic acid export membrane protein